MKINKINKLMLCAVIICTTMFSCSNKNEEILIIMNTKWIEKKQGKIFSTTSKDRLTVKDFKSKFENETKMKIRLVSKYKVEDNGLKYVLYLFFPLEAEDIQVILCKDESGEIGYFNHYPNGVLTSPNEFDIHPIE